MTRIIILFALAGVILAGCGGDKGAIDQAQAERIEQETRQSIDERQAEEARRQANWESTRGAASFAKQALLVLVVCTLAVTLSATLTIAVYRWWEASRAIVTFAEGRALLRSGAVYVDKKTLTWPTLVLNGAVHNLETSEVFLLGAPKGPDPQQVTGDALVRALGVGARGAVQIAKSTKDGQTADALPGMAGALPLVLRPIEQGQSRRLEYNSAD